MQSTVCISNLLYRNRITTLCGVISVILFSSEKVILCLLIQAIVENVYGQRLCWSWYWRIKICYDHFLSHPLWFIIDSNLTLYHVVLCNLVVTK